MLFRHLTIPTDPVRTQYTARAADPCMASQMGECAMHMYALIDAEMSQVPPDDLDKRGVPTFPTLVG
jgi:hypothetical protein